jgi:arabinan endo-1,5-alpha-L-arabinosidase
MFLFKVLSAVLASAAAVVGTYPDPEACSGDCTAIDPAVIRRVSDGVYFRFITFDEIRIYKADALTGPWVLQGAAIPAGSIIDLAGNTDLWVRRHTPPPQWPIRPGGLLGGLLTQETGPRRQAGR